MKFRNAFPIFAFAVLSPALANAQWIVLGNDAATSLSGVVSRGEGITAEQVQAFGLAGTVGDRTVARLGASVEGVLLQTMHEQHHRCGGFTVHPTEEAALAEAGNPFYAPAYLSRTGLFPEGLDQQAQVRPALDLVDAARIVDTIRWMESLGTRYFESDAGQEAAVTLKAQWEGYGQGVAGFSVEAYPHAWKQDSVIATLQGAELPDEIVVIGGHLDSINGADVADAPGADDNASGIAVVSEVLRVILDSGFRPRRTMQFMAYAAEEVGLRGSGEIARQYRDEDRTVIAALQADMTGFAGSPDDMYFVTDYVSTDLTGLLKNLIAEYNADGPHRISFGETECGYACSDHASWTAVGVPSAFPFEALFEDYNRHIHSPSDLLAQIDAAGEKQARFAKLGLEFMMELAKSDPS